MFGDELDRFERSASIDGISNNDESEEEVAIAQLGGKLSGGVTKLTPAVTKKESLRTTVPISIVKEFEPTSGDSLD